jgi:signal transduction histidine kinase
LQQKHQEMKKLPLIVLLLILISVSASAEGDIAEYEKQFKKHLKTNPDSLFLLAGEVHRQAVESGDIKLQALTELYLGACYDKMSLYNKALQNYLQSLAKFERLKDTSYSFTLNNNIGNFYRHVEDFEKARSYYYRALKHAGDSAYSLKADVLNHLGDINLSQRNIDSAFLYYLSSLRISLLNDRYVTANNYNNIGDLFRIQKNYDSSTYYYLKSADILLGLNDPSELGENYSSLALLNLEHGNQRKAEFYLNKAITLLESGSFYYELEQAYKAGIEIYSKKNKLDSVVVYLAKLDKLHTWLSKEKNEQSLKAVELEYALREREVEFEILTKENEIQTLTVSLLLIAVIAVIVVIIAMWIRYKRKKKDFWRLNRQKLEIEKQKSELEETYERVRELNATKDKFFSIISHDLKGPVMSMKMMSKEIVDDFKTFSNEELEDLVHEFYEQSDNTLDLLTTLLDWSRSQRGLIKYNYDNIDIHYLVQSSINLHENVAEDKNIELVNEVPVEAMVYADSNTILGVLRNLISNAIKFTPKGGKVIVGAEEDSGFLKVFVRDTGVGISAEVIEMLFRIDVNVTTPGTNQEKGTGLGLILCKDFIENNSGEIWVESQEGKGSTFYFTLPVEQKNKHISPTVSAQ